MSIINKIISDIKSPIDRTIIKRKILPHIYQDMYMEDLEKNYEKNNVLFKPEKFAVDIPEREPPTKKENPRHVPTIDHVFIDLESDDEGVKVVFNTNFTELYDNFYKHNVVPPVKDIQRAYASVGYSDEFVKEMPDRRGKVIERCEAFDIRLM
jgi:hypothetical protein